MKCLIDIGNSNIVFAFSDSENIKQTYRYKTLKDKTCDELYLSYKTMLDLYDIDDVIISSVVPVLSSAFIKMFKKFLNITPKVLGPGLKSGISIKVDDPKTVGADLICDCAGAMKYAKEAIIIDLGTATKYIYCKNNIFYGCAIAPGVSVSLNALVSSADLLHSIELMTPKKVIGTSTNTSMLSGVIFSSASAVDGMIDRICEEINNENVTVIATGGLSKVIIPQCKHKIILCDDLTLLGLLDIYNKNV